MKLAFVSDVHGDVHALTDALASIAALGCDRVVCAGDLVDYWLFPDETIALLAERAIPTVRGNHDRWALAPKESRSGRGGADHGETYGGGRDLSDATLRFLEGLPTAWTGAFEGVRVAVHHASPRGDMDGIDPQVIDLADARAYLEKADCDVLVVGHTHVPFMLRIPGGRRIVTPGALLRAGQC
jgi:putative phosphoesterase